MFSGQGLTVRNNIKWMRKSEYKRWNDFFVGASLNFFTSRIDWVDSLGECHYIGNKFEKMQNCLHDHLEINSSQGVLPVYWSILVTDNWKLKVIFVYIINFFLLVFLNVNFERAMIYYLNLTTNIPIVSSFPIIVPLSGFLKLIFTVEYVDFRIFDSTLFLVQVSSYCSYLASRRWIVKNIGPRRPKKDYITNTFTMLR